MSVHFTPMHTTVSLLTLLTSHYYTATSNDY